MTKVNTPPRYVVAVLSILAAFTLTPTTAQAAPARSTVIGHFTKANDNPAKATAPRGTTTLQQKGGASGAITGVVRLHGMAPLTKYVTVPYTDGACTPDPGGTAFPSSQFTTNAEGTYVGPVTVNPAAVNPAATLDLSQVRSVSIRGVLASPPPPAPPTVPDPVFETCDMSPVVK